MAREPRVTKSPPPLDHKALRGRTLKVPRHDPARALAEAATTARFDIVGGAAGGHPQVSTRIVPNGERGRKAGWQVEVTVAGGQLRPAARRALDAVHVDRSELARAAVRALAPSMPEGDHKLSLKPRARRRPEPYKIRFGELRYDPTTIFPPDGRQPYYDENYPWRCLVRITTPNGWSGSGVLIGPRHVLTASHCVDWTPGWLQVDVLYSNTVSLATAGGVLAYFESKVGPGTIPDHQSDEDYAVIVLDQRLGDIYGWMGSRTYDSGWDNEVSVWQSIGYPQDWSLSGEIAAWQTNFFLDELGFDFGSARLLRSQTFDNWPGQSGSPVFGFWDDGPYVVGVVSGQTPDFNHISGGSLLPSLVSRARNEHP